MNTKELELLYKNEIKLELFEDNDNFIQAYKISLEKFFKNSNFKFSDIENQSPTQQIISLQLELIENFEVFQLIIENLKTYNEVLKAKLTLFIKETLHEILMPILEKANIENQVKPHINLGYYLDLFLCNFLDVDMYEFTAANFSFKETLVTYTDLFILSTFNIDVLIDLKKLA